MGRFCEIIDALEVEPLLSYCFPEHTQMEAEIEILAMPQLCHGPSQNQSSIC
jgi:hypothetical protein